MRPWGERGGDIMASSGGEGGAASAPLCALSSHGPPTAPRDSTPSALTPLLPEGSLQNCLPQRWTCVLPVPTAGRPELSGHAREMPSPVGTGPPVPHSGETTRSNSIDT